MYGLTVAILAAIAACASSAPAFGGVQDDLSNKYWAACGPALRQGNIASPNVPLNVSKLVDQDTWFITASSKSWLAAATKVPEPSTITCAPWKVSTSADKNATSFTLSTNAQNQPAYVLSTVVVGSPDVAPTSPVQTLQQTTASAITGLSFLQLDDMNAAFIGCTYDSALTANQTSWFFNVLTRNASVGADAAAWKKVTDAAAAVPSTVDVSDAAVAKRNDNQGCSSGATQITAMTALVLAAFAFLRLF